MHITCDHGKRAITNALTPIGGVPSIAVDIPAKQVRLEYDTDRVDLERIKTILEEEYYPVASPASVNGATVTENTHMATATVVDPRTARFTADHAGQTCYFCSPGC